MVNVDNWVHYPKQEKAYYEAIERQDWYAVNILYIPPIYTPLETIKMTMRSNELVNNFKEELNRIKNTSNELLELENEIKYKIITKKL